MVFAKYQVHVHTIVNTISVTPHTLEPFLLSVNHGFVMITM